MDKSFRMILEERMNPREAAPAGAFNASNTFNISHDPFASITWSARAQVKPRMAYAREKMQSRESARLARRPKPEVLIPLVKLSHDDLGRVRRLIELGAEELGHGLSIRLLKVAYRRLARRYHPDLAGPEGHLTFVEVRTAYAPLLENLPSY